jgi:DNA repair protein RadA/Sms
MTVDEPAADLGVAAAVASSFRNRAVRNGTAVFGEIGLAGEIRAITQAPRRVREAAQMGFTRCLLPAGNLDGHDLAPEPGRAEARGGAPACELIGVRTIGEALDLLFN